MIIPREPYLNELMIFRPLSYGGEESTFELKVEN